MPPFILNGFPAFFPAFGAEQIDDDSCVFTQYGINCRQAVVVFDNSNAAATQVCYEKRFGNERLRIS